MRRRAGSGIVLNPAPRLKMWQRSAGRADNRATPPGAEAMTRTERNLSDAAEPPARRKLPIGVQTFRTIREDGSYYVDKTPFIRRLVEEGGHYFLSRPRRFGKSLLVDTIKELFEDNEPLFRGLAVHDQWDWSARHPVVRLDFSQGDYKQADYLHANVAAQLDRIERRAGLASRYPTAPERFGDLIEALHERTGRRVTVLVDEYDKPILDALEEPETARANRDYLSGLYSTVKFADAHIAFSLFTGVSKFSKVSLFSGLNNLKDITLDPRYSAICGYTDSVFYSCFAALGLEVTVEDSTSHGRLDMAVVFNGHVYLFEFKVVESQPDGEALAQLRECGYADKYRASGRPIHLIGVEFSKETRNVAAFEVATA